MNSSAAQRMADEPSDAPAQDDALSSDESVVLLCARQPQAFAELYRRYETRVYRYLLVRVGSAHDAQDLTSQAFVAAFEGIRSYAGKGAFAAWLFGIARRKLVDHFRHYDHALPLDDAASEPHPGQTLDQQTHERLQLNQITAALRRIAPERAEALSLRIFGELSSAEIAVLMNKSDAAVRMLVHRAIEDIRKIVGVK